MQWIHYYQLFLFDFDGILVNTESLHYRAYLKMCATRGHFLDWDEKTYTRHAMFTASGLKEGIYRCLPALEKEQPDWDILYEEKKQAYWDLLISEGVSLMPGVKELLVALAKADIKRCVVTHSTHEQITLIRKQQPLLDSIPLWITRKDYKEPKPSSECYFKAIQQLHVPKERMVGFEDSPRGLKALLGTPADAVLISSFFEPSELNDLSQEMGREFSHFSSLSEINF